MNSDRAQIDELRAELQAAGLPDGIEERDPLEVLTEWIALGADLGFASPDAMVIATVGADGTPSARNVLMRGIVDGRLTFYTNHRSQKGVDLLARPFAECIFTWLELDRQIRVRGPVRQLDAAQSDAYFAARPIGSQVASVASDQSQPIPDRGWLERRFKALTAAHDGRPVDRPAHWGGFGVEPQRVEIWQGAKFRLHDRMAYERNVDGWTSQRLAP